MYAEEIERGADSEVIAEIGFRRQNLLLVLLRTYHQQTA